MQLNTLWFILIAVLYSGYFVLEGFDFGVGALLPFLSKQDTRRRVILNSIGPHWDGNEVWLVVAGGATFAAFPNWYATLFSGFYLPLFLMLVALILRGVAFEFRSKDENPLWRSTWDWVICIGSIVPSVLWGVAFSNFMRGVPIDAKMQYVGGFWNLLNPYALLGGLAFLAVFLFHGANFLTLKTTGKLLDDCRQAAGRLWIPAFVLLAVYAVFTAVVAKSTALPIILLILTVASILAAGWFVRSRQGGKAFIATVMTILFTGGAIFSSLYPRVMVSSLNPDWSLTIFNAASGITTLQTMTTIVIILLPVVLAYQAFTYWVFRKRISEKTKELEY